MALAVVTADCVPVLLGDARAGVVAAAHAGRVGAQNGVVARTVEAMLDVGAHVEDISVLLGPVGQRTQLRGSRGDGRRGGGHPAGQSHDHRSRARPDWTCGPESPRQLTDLGITAIDVDPRCTVEDRNLFSHRRDAPTGRLASLVWME